MEFDLLIFCVGIRLSHFSMLLGSCNSKEDMNEYDGISQMLKQEQNSRKYP